MRDTHAFTGVVEPSLLVTIASVPPLPRRSCSRGLKPIFKAVVATGAFFANESPEPAFENTPCGMAMV